MKKIIFLVIFSLSSQLLAEAPVQQQKEIRYLFSFIKDSQCKLNRNGTDYPAEEALEHIAKKYSYFKNEIKTTEDFIKFAATKSTLSGKYYTVNCGDNKTLKTQQWLLAELSRYRSENSMHKVTLCKEPRPQVCTMEYVPVCARLEDGSVKTYSSGCNACADAVVKSYKPKACK